jgi:aspartyl-tRNA(Asn)/glutamyl-tRNA(Gln) amidotransferase subunit A
VGFKKSLGLVPHETAPDAFGNVSYIDPTTRTVLDCALMLEAMAGPDPSDPHSAWIPHTGFVDAVERGGDLSGVRIAWRPFIGNRGIDRELLRLCETAFGAFRELKAETSEMADDFEPTEPVFQVLWASLLNARYRQYVEKYGPRMSETLLRQMDQGVKATGEQVLKALFTRTNVYRQIQGWFTNVDLIVTPTMTRTAVPIDHDLFAPILIDNQPAGTVRQSWYPCTHPFNLSGHPAISLPAGFHPDGLPVALQIVGRRGEDALVLRAAAAFERMRPWTTRRPALPELDA